MTGGAETGRDVPQPDTAGLGEAGPGDTPPARQSHRKTAGTAASLVFGDTLVSGHPAPPGDLSRLGDIHLKENRPPSCANQAEGAVVPTAAARSLARRSRRPAVALVLLSLLVAAGGLGGWRQRAAPSGNQPGDAIPAGELAATFPVLRHESPPPGMVWIPPGRFLMGNADGELDERPVHAVEVGGFWLDATEVTNAEFARFVRATGYVTDAERLPSAPLSAPGPRQRGGTVPAGSLCFFPGTAPPVSPRRPGEPGGPAAGDLGWRFVPGANWRHPEGPDSDLRGRDEHPVVQVSHSDAVAYCQWVGKRLPTEAEWEYAARLGGELGPEGEPPQDPHGVWRMNLWQGEFPVVDEREDGQGGPGPVRGFPANRWGVYGLGGNVWEWCADWYRPKAYASARRVDPPGPASGWGEPGAEHRVMRGGSYLCSPGFCQGYRAAARMHGAFGSATGHGGFRAARSVRKDVPLAPGLSSPE
jgi:formylglycine-generating enzyme required for sulfatase activity